VGPSVCGCVRGGRDFLWEKTGSNVVECAGKGGEPRVCGCRKAGATLRRGLSRLYNPESPTGGGVGSLPGEQSCGMSKPQKDAAKQAKKPGGDRYC